MILLMIMLFFHRYHMLKYLYIVNLFCMFLAVSTYFIFIKKPVGYNRTWMQAIPFIWLFGIFGEYSLSILSIVAFVIEHAQRHLWARVMIRLVCLIFFSTMYTLVLSTYTGNFITEERIMEFLFSLSNSGFLAKYSHNTI